MSSFTKLHMAGCAAIAATAIGFPAAHAVDLADGRINLDFKYMTGFQSLGADPGAFAVVNEDPSAGFIRNRFNMEFTFDINDWISVFVDVGEEPNDFGDGGGFQLSNDLSFIDFAVVKEEDNSFVVRVGEPVTLTWNYRGYSDGAAVQDNPLIGNSPFDVVTAESGVQLIGQHGLFGWDVAYTTPTFGEDFSPEVGFDLTGRIRFDVGGGFKIGGGFMQTDAEDQWQRVQVGGVAADANLATTEALFGDNENYNFPGTTVSSRSTHQGLIPGVDATTLMIDAQWEPVGLTGSVFRAWYGMIKDDYRFQDAAGNQTVRAVSGNIVRGESEVQGIGLEGSVYVIPSTFYVAARYTLVTNETAGIANAGDLDRTQLGVGWWLAATTLVKAEYVAQSEEANSAGQIGSDWDGFALEVSTVF